MNTWKAWSQRLVQVGPANFYSNDYFSDYFPGYLYILWIAGGFYHFIFPNLSFADLKFESMIKLVTLAFDIATSYYIYKIVNNYSKKLSKLSVLLYMSNPAVIFNSSIWGQVDGIFMFFIVYSCFLLTEVKKPIASSFLLSLAVLIKPQSLAILPMILLYNFKLYKKYLVTILLAVVLTPIVLSLPFFINDPFFGLVKLFQNATIVYPYTSLFAFNFWGILGWWKSDAKLFLTLPYQVWGIILYTVSMILILYPALKNKIKPGHFYIASSLSFMAFYIFLTRIHERYLFPSLSFILIAAFLNRSKKLGMIYFLISIVHLINLWYVYYYYNFVYNNPGVSFNKLYLFINDYYKLFSLILLASFAVVLFVYYRIIYVKKNKA